MHSIVWRWRNFATWAEVNVSGQVADLSNRSEFMAIRFRTNSNPDLYRLLDGFLQRPKDVGGAGVELAARHHLLRE